MIDLQWSILVITKEASNMEESFTSSPVVTLNQSRFIFTKHNIQRILNTIFLLLVGSKMR